MGRSRGRPLTNWSSRVERSQSPVPSGPSRPSPAPVPASKRRSPTAGPRPQEPSRCGQLVSVTGRPGRPSRFRVSNSQGPAPRAHQLVVECGATGRPTLTVPHPRPSDLVGENDKGLPDGPRLTNWSYPGGRPSHSPNPRPTGLTLRAGPVPDPTSEKTTKSTGRCPRPPTGLEGWAGRPFPHPDGPSNQLVLYVWGGRPTVPPSRPTWPTGLTHGGTVPGPGRPRPHEKSPKSPGRPSPPTNWSLYTSPAPKPGDRPASVPANWSHSPGPPAVPVPAPQLPTPIFYSTPPAVPTPMPTGLTLNGRPSHRPSARQLVSLTGPRPAPPDRSPCPPTGLLPPGDRPRPPTLTQTAKSPRRFSRPPTGLTHLGGRPTRLRDRSPAHQLVSLTAPGSRPSRQLV